MPPELHGLASKLTKHRTAEEIRSLSRFQVVQRTGFTKILKKYRRWTRDRELDRVFKEEISSRPDSLFQLDLGHLLDQYVDVLGSLRTVFDNDSVSMSYNKDASAQLPAARIAKSLDQHDGLEFDLALSTIPLGTEGTKATYWVHPDHIVEVQVLLLQHMRLHTKGSRPSSQRDSVQTTPARRLSDHAGFDRNFGNEGYTGLVVLDYAEAFALKQNASTIASSEGNKGTIGLQAAGNVRCSPSGDATVAICTRTSSLEQASENIKTAKLKRKSIKDFLDASKPFQPETDGDEADTATIRQWLTEHQEIKPIAGVGSKRTRFVGLHNSSVGGVWAALDRDVFMKDPLVQEFDNDDWASTASTNSAKFPHAILEVRREGGQATSLIKILDRSHLVCWTCTWSAKVY
jgi:SPX domain protein involved in polyphosphate accumulation